MSAFSRVFLTFIILCFSQASFAAEGVFLYFSQDLVTPDEVWDNVYSHIENGKKSRGAMVLREQKTECEE